MEVDGGIYFEQIVSEIIDDLNTNKFSELAELVEMKYGSKPEPELQRLASVQVVAIDASGLHLLCKYHRWETAENIDRMFSQHTDETKRLYVIPWIAPPRSQEELRAIIEKMINEGKESYLKGFE